MVLGRMRNSGQSTFRHQTFIRLLPCGDRISSLDPMTVRCFITPFRQSCHHTSVSSRAAKSSHRLFALPYGQSPERHPWVNQKSPTQESCRTLNLTLTEKCTPQELWKKPYRAHSQARHRCKHNGSMFRSVSRRKIRYWSSPGKILTAFRIAPNEKRGRANQFFLTTQPSPPSEGWQSAAAVLPTPASPCRIQRSPETADHPRARVPGRGAPR